jgi:hypothetical protein
MSRGKQGKEGDDLRRLTFVRKHELGLEVVVVCDGVALIKELDFVLLLTKERVDVVRCALREP